MRRSPRRWPHEPKAQRAALAALADVEAPVPELMLPLDVPDPEVPVPEEVDGLVLEPLLVDPEVPLVDVLPLVPPGVVLVPLGVVVVVVSREVEVDSSRFWHAARDASAIKVMALACAIFRAFMTVPC